MSKISKSFMALGLACMSAAMVLPQAAVAQPQLTIQSERAAHPDIVRAINAINAALADLQRAPHDFGGNKGQAMRDGRAAIHSLKKALYYRLHLDDEAIDRAQ